MILVTGANGQLGRCFQQLASQFPEFQFVFAGSVDLDVSDRAAVLDFFEKVLGADQPINQSVNQSTSQPICINCAAYTAVDKAEKEREDAHLANVLGPRNLAAACAMHDIPLIHFSTDYVYHTRHNTPLREFDPVRPKGEYASTKLAGERAALRTWPLTMVIRTSWVYSEFGQNFLKTMLRLGAERESLGVVFDQIGTPTYAPDLAAAVLRILQQLKTGEVEREALAGIWHYSNEGVASWYDFAQAIFEIKNLPCRLRPIETKDFPTPAQRPPFSVLNKAKIKAAFGLEIPHWRESLARCLAHMP